MAVPNPSLLNLSAEDGRRLEAWLVNFDRTWQEDLLARRVQELPPTGTPWRFPALVEMVKIDLERQWQRGQRPGLENYLQTYPELGDPVSVPVDLLQAEYEVRQQFSSGPDLAEFARRFPHQAEELRRLVDQAPASTLRGQSGGDGLASLRPSTVTNAPPPQAGTLPEQFGRYRIVRKLGRGGMGAVYLAHDPQLDRQVALKVPHFSADDSPEILERFFREARSAAALHHPHICPVHDVGRVNDLPYLTMAYVEGQALAERLQGGATPPAREAAELLRKLALALEEAHRAGIVHRDLKPSNVMIDRRGEPVIMDFGLARRDNKDETQLTQSGAVLGTPAYMPPEQALGDRKAVGPCSDIYSLGVILYQLLAGRVPFEGTLGSILAQIATVPPAAPSAVRAGVDRRLEAICLKAMAKQPADRYATMGDLAAALMAYLDSTGPEPRQATLSAVTVASTVSWKPASGEHRAGDLRRRHRLAVVAGGAVALMLLGIASVIRRPAGREEPPTPDVPPVRIAEPPKPPLANQPEETKRAEPRPAPKPAAPEVRPAADSALVQRLIENLGDDDGAVRRQAANELRRLGSAARLAVPALGKRVADHLWVAGNSYDQSDPIAGGKSAALAALQALAPEQVTGALLEALQSREVKVRAWAAARLAAQTNKPAVPALVQALKDDEGPVRKEAADSLRVLKAKEAVPALMERVADEIWVAGDSFGQNSDPEAGGKAAALRALKELAPERVKETLLTAMKATDAHVKTWATRQYQLQP
jgi:predicted Ser/Thr protein kinase